MEKRLFFGMQVHAPWPDHFPYGRLLDENHRHLTLAFLGKIDFLKMQEALSSFPAPTFKVGFAAQFDECLFLPPKHSRVVAWHVKWLEESAEVNSFYETLVHWLKEKGFSFDARHGFMPHVTLARAPFNIRAWSRKFSPLPVIVQDIHLYESLGNLKYAPVWSYPLLSPFEEIEHTADIAYVVRGHSYDQLFYHGALALAFNFPPILPYLQSKEICSQLEEVVIELNHVVARADQEIGCPFKAVSFHSQLEKKDGVLHWEMIIDV